MAIALVHHGRRLVPRPRQPGRAAGAIASPDDVYFLTLTELVSALEGGAVPRRPSSGAAAPTSGSARRTSRATWTWRRAGRGARPAPARATAS
jgi:hypothetical protein